jgi:hypothetical protein
METTEAVQQAPIRRPVNIVTKYNVGFFCLSEDDCIEQGISFAAYERGVADAAEAFSATPENEVGPLRAAAPVQPAEPLRMLTLPGVISWLERQASNTDTDPRWIAATGLRTFAGLDWPAGPERVYPAAPQPTEPVRMTDARIEEIAARIGSLSLHATRVHELGGKTRTIFDPKGLIEFARAIEAEALNEIRAALRARLEGTTK